MPHSDRVEQMRLYRSGKLRCAVCDEIKHVDQFGAVPAGKQLPRQPCKPCYSERQKERYRNSQGVDRIYANLLKRAYGLTMEQYQGMVAGQGGVCAICGLAPVKRRSKTRVRLQVDHDHKTGAVRELLCSRCNRLVWAVEDHHGLLAAVIAYLDKHGQPGASVTPDNEYYQLLEPVAPQDFRPSEPGSMPADHAQVGHSGVAGKPQILRSPVSAQVERHVG